MRRTRPATEQGDPTSSALPRLLRIASTAIAPITLLTALLFFFGWSHAYSFYNYFGVDSSTLGLTRQDYVMRSQDSLFVPLVVVGLLWLPALWGHTALRARLAPRPPSQQTKVIALMMLIGLVLAALGLSQLRFESFLASYVALAPMLLICGVVFFFYSVSLGRSLREEGHSPRSSQFAVAEWVGVFILVGLGLFWAVNDYSAAVGSKRAEEQYETIAELPSVAIFADHSLSLNIPDIIETRCGNDDAHFRYSYLGFKLVEQVGNQYLLLPATWTPIRGYALLLPRSDSIRLEFSPASTKTDLRPC
ncbi:hypothetical protein ACFTZB_19925 [Rhodococcus sp. NPDC057014]|uniref:hypothetical protein n=1 Tax=Rhodococcus sp. NPDC057014 TaxID=3346000 RepID=UPI00362BEC12